MTFDWDSFWVNIISDAAFFVVTIPIVIMFLPDIAIWLLKKRNKRHLTVKFSSILIELCEFIALCNINVFSKVVYPKILLVIHDYHKKLTIEESYKLMTEEYQRLKTFRTDIERILSAHSLLLDEEIILKISNLCFDIRRVEIDFKVNDMHDDLLQKTNSERTGFFGLNKLPKIYESTLYLIKDMLTMDCFEYEIQKGKN